MRPNCNCRKCRAKRAEQEYEHDDYEYEYQYGRKNSKCNTDCDSGVKVDVGVCPEVKCKQTQKCGKTSFDIELDLKTRPKCVIREKRVIQKCGSKCDSKCVFVVDVDVDFDCKPKITKRPGRPFAKYDLDVKVGTASSTKVEKNRKHGRRH